LHQKPVTLRIGGLRKLAYWTETGVDRIQLLDRFAGNLQPRRCGAALDSGWSDWDLEIPCNLLSRLQIRTAQEDHGGSKRLIRVRCELRPSWMAVMSAVLCLPVLAATDFQWPVVVACLIALPVVWLGAWRRGLRIAGRLVGVLDDLAGELGLISAEREATEY
jgi:hypothetical protein